MEDQWFLLSFFILQTCSLAYVFVIYLVKNIMYLVKLWTINALKQLFIYIKNIIIKIILFIPTQIDTHMFCYQ